ncbi:hypothetical protein Tco_0457878 [Tanacetum coccineum]
MVEELSEMPSKLDWIARDVLWIAFASQNHRCSYSGTIELEFDALIRMFSLEHMYSEDFDTTGEVSIKLNPLNIGLYKQFLAHLTLVLSQQLEEHFIDFMD